LKPKVCGLLFVLAFLSFGLIEGLFVNVTRANFVVDLPYITIYSDGSVEPETEYITRVGGTYFLTANLSQYAIRIQCSNIIFDGQGHCINGTITSSIGYGNNGLSLVGLTNVTVKNVEVLGFMNDDFWMGSCNNCSLINVQSTRMFFDNCSNCSFTRLNALNLYLYRSSYINVTESTAGNNGLGYLKMALSNNCVLSRNNFTSLNVRGCYSNTFFENNFFGEYDIGNSAGSWDNGLVGNFWSDYLSKYHNASEIGSSGMGDTPYVIDADNADNYPLMAPFELMSSPAASSISESQPEPSLALILGILGISIFGAIVCIFCCLKKGNH